MAHHSSHAASEIARYQSGQFKQHQRNSLKIFKNTPDKRFLIGDRVLIRKKPHAFQKASPIFFPSYEADIYKVIHIDTKFLPYKYLIQNTNKTHVKKQLYAFEMVKLAQNSEFLKTNPTPLLSEPTKQIYVSDVILQNPSKLRSGRKIVGKETVFYRIKLNNKEEILSEKGLRVLQKSLGVDSLSYSPFFSLKENRKYILN